MLLRQSVLFTNGSRSCVHAASSKHIRGRFRARCYIDRPRNLKCPIRNSEFSSGPTLQTRSIWDKRRPCLLQPTRPRGKVAKQRNNYTAHLEQTARSDDPDVKRLCTWTCWAAVLAARIGLTDPITSGLKLRCGLVMRTAAS